MATEITNLLEPAFQEFRSASAEEIARIEELAQGRLPEDYVEFLQRFGWSSFAGESTLRGPEGVRYSPFVFFAAEGEKCSVIGDLQSHPEYCEQGFVPVADDLFNNRFVLDLTSGEVRYIQYSHGRREVTLAPSFRAFMLNLKVVVEGAL